MEGRLIYPDYTDRWLPQTAMQVGTAPNRPTKLIGELSGSPSAPTPALWLLTISSTIGCAKVSDHEPNHSPRRHRAARGPVALAQAAERKTEDEVLRPARMRAVLDAGKIKHGKWLMFFGLRFSCGC